MAEQQAGVDVVSVLERARDDLRARGQAYIAEQAAVDAMAELIAFADSALHYVDEVVKVERERHRANGAPNSQVLAQTVADGLRAALARVQGGS